MRHPAWDWLGKPDAPSEPQNSAAKGFSYQSFDPDTGKQVLALLRLEKGALQLSTNSVARMKRATELLERALGQEISAGLTSLTPAQGALRQAGERRPTKAGDADGIPPEVVAKITRQFFDRHYRDWMDTALPILDGRSPRQAVSTERGQDEVVALLKSIENMETRQSQKSGQPPYDFGWLWQELGLAARRSGAQLGDFIP